MDEERTAWRPIETAPKDRTHVLVGRFPPHKTALFPEYDGRVRVDYWHLQPKDDFTGWGQFNERYWPATHWMPLPEPPHD